MSRAGSRCLPLRVLIVTVGRPHNLAAPIAGYEARAGRYWPLEVREVREVSARGLSPDVVRVREGERLLAAAGNASLVACDERGEQLSSPQFAEWLSGQRDRGAGDVAFLLGGAFGLSAAVRERSQRVLAFTRWTLPHELARLVLAEQLYRAGTIVRGEPYHK